MNLNNISDQIVFKFLKKIEYGQLKIINYDNKEYFFGNKNEKLSVQLLESKQELAIKKSEVSTRANLKFTAKFQLQGLKEFAGRSLAGEAKIVTSYNILSSDFGTLATEKDARRRAVRELSEVITNRIASYLQAPS